MHEPYYYYVHVWGLKLQVDRSFPGQQLSELVVVADNAPAHSQLYHVFEGTDAMLLRLGPYSPMLNPIESIWSKVKAFVKAQMRVPLVEGPNMQEQRLRYLEEILQGAMVTAPDLLNIPLRSTMPRWTNLIWMLVYDLWVFVN